MRIGIMTYHNAHNYGAMLQAYALQQVISEMNHEVEFIDFRPYYEKSNLIHKLKDTFKKLVSKLPNNIGAVLFGDSIKRYNAFDCFMNNQLILSKKKYKTIAELYKKTPDYDAYIVGSDQVWNPEICGMNLDAYLLDFVKDKSKKKIAYAVSFGSPEILEAYKNLIIPYLYKFDSISVREDDVVERIKQFSNKNIIATIDPTLLLNRERWSEISILPNEKDYILIYILEQSQDTFDLINDIIRQIRLSVINFSVNCTFENEVKKATAAGPREFLGYFENAKIIITNSFHGTIFPIIYKKPFYSILPKERSSRIRSLLTKLEMTNRIVEQKNSLLTFSTGETIDYDKVYKLLEEEKQKSIGFLSDTLI